MNFYKQNRTGDLMNRISEDVSKVRMYVGPAVMYTINTVIRFAIVIVYMYNVINIDFVHAATASILSYTFKLSEINVRSTIFQQYLKYLVFHKRYFLEFSNKSLFTRNQHQNNMVTLANESKSKSLNLAKIQSLFGPLMLALIGISNLVVIYFVV
jgi:ATP-binding cassette subfamily B protein